MAGTGMTLCNKKKQKQQEQFSAAISGTRGSKGSKPKSSTKPDQEDETSQQSTSTITTPTDDSDTRNAHLVKQNLIKEAWSKRNKVIFHGLGKMMAQAYEAALKNIK